MLFRFLQLLLLVLLGVGLHTPSVNAGPALLFDASNNKVLYAHDADRLWYPASLTKIMTAYVVFEAIKNGELTLETKLVSSALAAKEPPSKIGLPIGAEISLEFGLRALIIKSANDVAVMLAQAVAGSPEFFIARMNRTAKRLGMTRTTFVNPNGLPVPGQVTTARDLGRLVVAVARDFPQYTRYWAMPYLRIGKRRLRSHNALLRTYDGADGVKTGFICDSGFNVVASATRNGRRLIAIVLGSPSSKTRNRRARDLLDHGFLTHDWKLYFQPDDLVSMPASTTSNQIVSVRKSVAGWACGNRRVTRRRARSRRRRKLRRKQPPRKGAVIRKKKAASARTAQR